MKPTRSRATTKMLFGIGNALSGDDGVGCYVARNLVGEGWHAVDCGTAPENFTALVRRRAPELLVLVDAADMGLPAGEFRVLPHEKLDTFCAGTHKMAFSVLVSYLRELADNVVFIGIQPSSTTRLAELSEPVRKGADALITLLKKERLEELKRL